MFISRSRCLAVICLLAFLPVLAHAQYTTYTDRTAFETANPGLQTEDFESGDDAGNFLACNSPLDSTGDGVCFQDGGLLPGVVYSAPTRPGPAALVLVGPNAGYTNTSKNLINNYSSDDFVMDFSAPDNNAVGMDVVCYYNSGTTTVDVYGSGGLITSETVSCSNDGVFFGIVASESITQVQISSAQFDGVDNLSFGVGEAPEPTPVARFTVTKDFSDNNPADVSVTISCNAGLPLTQTFVIRDADSDPGDTLAGPATSVTFTVKDFADGAMDCTISEDDPADGYTQQYVSSDASDGNGCQFNDVAWSSAHSCVIENTLEPVPYTIDLDWLGADVAGGFDDELFVELTCENIRQGADGDLTGGTESGAMYPGDFPFSIALYPNYGTPESRCRTMVTAADSAVELDGACDDWLVLPLGGDEVSCTVTASVFFEGIPALDTRGLAILALLMLGMGALVMRRIA